MKQIRPTTREKVGGPRYGGPAPKFDPGALEKALRISPGPDGPPDPGSRAALERIAAKAAEQARDEIRIVVHPKLRERLEGALARGTYGATIEDAAVRAIERDMERLIEMEARHG